MQFSSTYRFFAAALALFLTVTACAPHLTSDLPPASPSARSAGLESNREKAMAPVPEQRPGLATGWGDEKKSAINYRDFSRASSKPYGTDSIFYNNSDGIDAMAGNLRRVSAMQRAAGGIVEWGIKGNFGSLPTYREFGDGRRLVAGRKGSEYAIVVKNRSRHVIEVVTSVDGLDVLDGKPATFQKRGYLINPGTTLEIEGFRTSMGTIAAFKFSSVSNSYANLRHGDTRNVGVIGLAVFTQKGSDPWIGDDAQLRNRATPFATPP